MDETPLYGREFSHHVKLVEFVQPLSVGFFLFLTTSLTSTKDVIFNLLEMKPEEVHLIEMHSTCYRMTGGTRKFRLHLILSFLPREKKRTKIKTWRKSIQAFRFIQRKAMFCFHKLLFLCQ